MILKTQRAAAEFLEIDPAQFSRLKTKGRFRSAVVGKKGKKKYWDSEKLKTAHTSSRNPMHDNSRKKPAVKITDAEKQQFLELTDFDWGMDFHAANTLNERFKAARAKLAYEKEIGEVINAKEVEKKTFQIARQVRDACLAISDRCSSMVAVENDQFRCKQILDIEIKHILENLSNAVKTM